MKHLSIELYKKMFLIRSAELQIQEIYAQDEMKTPMHMSMGEEAIVAGVVGALNAEDQVLGTYRSHALYLAKTGDTERFYAEMFGKVGGCARGKAGSMHLSALGQGLLCCSAIVASGIPVAMGAAFANKYKNNGKRVAVFFGDGAMDEGVFWETINFCGLHKLPILFICEDNGFAVHTRREKRQRFSSDHQLFENFGIKAFEENTTDPEIIYNTTRNALNHLQTTGQPCFLRFHYYRYLEHVGINEDFDAGYRDREEFLAWREKDPLRMQRQKLLGQGVSLALIEALEHEINAKVEAGIRFARQSSFPAECETYQGVFQCA
ncbi:MAG: thiamine pyrophosphate-dependent dehydrogenase E1 component subunit alpha [Desulfobacteraceae bacterium]|nr:thiamine pyrophosphate-dependent dehydrogenase E1 component subunit alpha [Desulfobacteraceae bacterium]